VDHKYLNVVAHYSLKVVPLPVPVLQLYNCRHL
jgi:hypothetical protein